VIFFSLTTQTPMGARNFASVSSNTARAIVQKVEKQQVSRSIITRDQEQVLTQVLTQVLKQWKYLNKTCRNRDAPTDLVVFRRFVVAKRDLVPIDRFTVINGGHEFQRHLPKP
jgi:hypothetical protein